MQNGALAAAHGGATSRKNTILPPDGRMQMSTEMLRTRKMNPSVIVVMFCLQFGIVVEHVSCQIQNVTLPVVIWHGMGNAIYDVGLPVSNNKTGL